MDFLSPIFSFLISFFVFNETRKEIQHGIPGAWLGYFTTLLLGTTAIINLKQATIPEGYELVFAPMFNIFFKIIFMGTIIHFVYLVIRSILSGFGGGPKRPRNV